MLTQIDYGVIAVYAALMTWIGILAKRKSSDVDQYFAAGHGLPWWMAAISHHVSGYSAVVFVGFAGRAAVTGFSMWTLFSLGVFVALVLGCLIWAPRWSRLKVLTPVEYLEARYGNSVRGLIAVSGILIKFIDLGIKLFAISIVVHVVTGWEVVPIIVVSGLITIAYVFIGGLWATVLTDLVQFVVQLVMSLAVLFIALDMVGGWTTMWDSLPPERAGFFNSAEGISPGFWLVYVVVIILTGLLQRAESPNDRPGVGGLNPVVLVSWSKEGPPAFRIPWSGDVRGRSCPELSPFPPWSRKPSTNLAGCSPTPRSAGTWPSI